MPLNETKLIDHHHHPTLLYVMKRGLAKYEISFLRFNFYGFLGGDSERRRFGSRKTGFSILHLPKKKFSKSHLEHASLGGIEKHPNRQESDVIEL